MTNLPNKLLNEPLLDAIFELRFGGKAASSIIPGYLYKELGLDSLPESLDSPHASIPFQIRDADPFLRYACFTKLEWGNFFIVVGDRALGVGCRLPYPGWEEFYKAISKVLSLVEKLEVIESVERYSFKYVNLIKAKTIQEQISLIDIDISLAGFDLKDQNFSTMMTIEKGDSIHIINIASGIKVENRSDNSFVGIIVDVDSVVKVDKESLKDWLATSEEKVVGLRHANKEIFFKCLSDKAIKLLGPSYE